MHRLHSVERNCEVTGVFDVDHKLVPAVRRDRPDGTKLFAAIRYERLESHCDFLLHDLLPAMINSLRTWARPAVSTLLTGRKHPAEACLIPHHSRVCFGCFLERNLFDRRLVFSDAAHHANEAADADY